MEFNEKVWLRAAINGIRPIIEYKINTGAEIDFKGLVIREKQNLRKWWEKENPLKSSRLSQDYRKFLAKLDTLDDLLEQSTREIEIECRKSLKVRGHSQFDSGQCRLFRILVFKTEISCKTDGAHK